MFCSRTARTATTGQAGSRQSVLAAVVNASCGHILHVLRCCHGVARGVGAILGSPVKRVGVNLGQAVETEAISAHGLFMEQDGTRNHSL